MNEDAAGEEMEMNDREGGAQSSSYLGYYSNTYLDILVLQFSNKLLWSFRNGKPHLSSISPPNLSPQLFIATENDDAAAAASYDESPFLLL